MLRRFTSSSTLTSTVITTARRFVVTRVSCTTYFCAPLTPLESLSSSSSSTLMFDSKRFTASAASSSSSSASSASTSDQKTKGLREAQEEEDSAFEDPEEAEANSRLSAEDKEKKEDELALKRYMKYSLLILTGVIGAYFANEHAKKTIGFKEKDSTYVHVNTRGRPSLGGPFVLVNCDGEVVSQADFLGKWVFFYFGFVHCPEICPIELNRMTKVVDMVRESRPNDTLQPLFVSCDVKRDSLAAIREYLSIFHKDFIGLVGTPNQVNNTCKSYRIYYSLPDDEGETSGDYLIDHSIAIFLFDPQGRFVDFFGSRYDHNEIAAKVKDYMGKYEADPEWTNY